MQLRQLQDNSTYCIYELDERCDAPFALITVSKFNGTITTIHGEQLLDVVESELYCCYKRNDYPSVIEL